MLRSEFRDQMAVCLGEPVDSHKHCVGSLAAGGLKRGRKVVSRAHVDIGWNA
jgi:hypothetical protein